MIKECYRIAEDYSKTMFRKNNKELYKWSESMSQNDYWKLQIEQDKKLLFYYRVSWNYVVTQTGIIKNFEDELGYVQAAMIKKKTLW